MALTADNFPCGSPFLRNVMTSPPRVWLELRLLFSSCKPAPLPCRSTSSRRPESEICLGIILHQPPPFGFWPLEILVTHVKTKSFEYMRARTRRAPGFTHQDRRLTRDGQVDRSAVKVGRRLVVEGRVVPLVPRDRKVMRPPHARTETRCRRGRPRVKRCSQSAMRASALGLIRRYSLARGRRNRLCASRRKWKERESAATRGGRGRRGPELPFESRRALVRFLCRERA